MEDFARAVPAEAAVEDISDPKSVVVPSEAPPSELGFRRQLLKDGGEEKVVPTPGRSDESEKLRKSEEEAAEGALVALVSSRPACKTKGTRGAKTTHQSRYSTSEGSAIENNDNDKKKEQKV